MQKISSPIFRLVILALCAASLAAGSVSFVKPTDQDWASIAGSPPEAGSDTEKQEIAQLLEWQNKRTAADVARCKSEMHLNPFIFSDVLGDKFSEQSLPVTAKLLKDVQANIKAIDEPIKEKWNRKRPPMVDERIQPAVDSDTSASFPSSHAIRGVVFADMLTQIFPDKKAQLIARGKLIGDDRVKAGIHFPSDVAAGQKLGAAIFDKLKNDPGYIEELKAAKAECDVAQIEK